MPCRASLHHKAVASVAAHIWISEDALTHAFNRFVRISNAGQQRHGSSVPGPLEAHRRLAKRRMGLESVGAAAPPPAADLGALFGLGLGKRKGDSMDWKWEAPAVASTVLLMPPYAIPPSLPGPLDVPPQTEDLTPQDDVDGSSIALSPMSDQFDLITSVEDAVEASKTTFKSVFEAKLDFPELDEEATTELCDFLNSSGNEPAARNLSRLKRRHALPPLAPPSLGVLSKTVCDKIKLGTIKMQDLVTVIYWIGTSQLANGEDIDRTTTSISLASACHDIWSALLSKPRTSRDARDANPTRPLLDLVYKLEPSVQTLTLEIDLVKNMAGNAPSYGKPALASAFAHAVRSIAVQKLINSTASEQAHLRLVDAVNHLPAELGQKILIRTMQLLLGRAVEEAAHPMARSDVGNLWLSCMAKSTASGRPSMTGSFWPKLYSEVARHFRPSELRRHFATLPSVDLARVLLYHWIPRALKDADRMVWQSDASQREVSRPITYQESASEVPRATTKRASFTGSHFEQFGVAYTMRKPPQPGPMNHPAILALDIARTFEQRLERDEHEDKYDIAPLHVLILSLNEHGARYADMLSEILHILAAGENDRRMLNLYLLLAGHKKMRMAPSLATELVQYFLGQDQPAFALYVCEATPKLWLTGIPDLSITLAERVAHLDIRTRLFALLNREHPSNSLPMNLRASPLNPLSESHIALVSLIAHSYAKSRLLTTRQAFRRVYECYRYLCDRQAPLPLLLSRAFVRTAAIRPLMNREWLSTEKFRFVLGLVERIEGREVAAALDQVVYRLRRAHLGVLAEQFGREFAARRIHEDNEIAEQSRREQGWNVMGWSRRSLRPGRPKKALTSEYCDHGGGCVTAEHASKPITTP